MTLAVMTVHPSREQCHRSSHANPLHPLFDWSLTAEELRAAATLVDEEICQYFESYPSASGLSIQSERATQAATATAAWSLGASPIGLIQRMN